MGFNKVYRPLFDVKLLHHYFLDEGEAVYGSTLDPENMEKNLAQYKLSNFMSVQPTENTINTLKNLRSRFVQSGYGFQVVTSTEGDEPFIPFSDTLTFDFILKITDQYFENYTNITINRSAPLFLTNLTPPPPLEVEEGKEETAVSVNFCLLSQFETSLTNGSPEPTLPMENIEVDLDDIDSRELFGAFAIIRIHLNGEAGEITLTDVDNSGNENEFNETLPEVTLMFKNRSTTWKYHRSKDSVIVHATDDELPLTKHGYIPVEDVDEKRYPNPSVSMIYKGENNVYLDTDNNPVPEDVTKKYSRIFI